MKKILFVFTILLTACTANKQASPEKILLSSDFSHEAIEQYINAVDTQNYELINKHIDGKEFYCHFGHFSEEYCDSMLNTQKAFWGEHTVASNLTVLYVPINYDEGITTYYIKETDEYYTNGDGSDKWYIYPSEWGEEWGKKHRTP